MESMFSMKSQGKLEILDYVAIFIVADILSATMMSILAGNFAGIMLFPTILFFWLIYESFRSSQNEN